MATDEDIYSRIKSLVDEEVMYLRSQRLARLATVARDGQPDVVPVGFEFDGTQIYVGGMDPVNARKYRNVETGKGSPT